MKSPAMRATTLTPIRREQLNATQEDRDGVLAQLSAAQVNGLGGGRFDTASKLRSGFGARALIINGLQSEPGNNSDLALLREDTRSVIAGAALAAFAVNTTSITLTLPDDARLSNEFATTLNSEIGEQAGWLTGLLSPAAPVSFTHRQLPAGHASGEEHQLATALGLLAKFPADNSALAALPLAQSGVVCINLATAYAIARAVYCGESLSRRMISINGVPDWIQLETPLLDIAGPGQTLDSLWINGRHGGYPANTLPTDARVHSGMFCIDTAPAAPAAPCINCSACVPACPVGLRPDELQQQLDQRPMPDAHLRLSDCIECGACNAVCPSGLWLAQSFRRARSAQKANVQKDQMAQKARDRSDARSARLIKLEEKRAARVQARNTQGRRAW